MDVIAKTLTSSIFLGFSSTAMMDTAVIMSRLNAADPTIVEGPSSPGSYSMKVIVSITDNMISGADEPSAIKERFATVGFHTISSIVPITWPEPSLISLIWVWEVISSIASIKMSEIIPMPRKIYPRRQR